MNKSEALQTREIGDKFEVYAAPSEFHQWTLKHGWKLDEWLDNYNVSIIKIGVVGSKHRGDPPIEFTEEKPFNVMGFKIKQGQFKSWSRDEFRADFSINNPMKLNDVLKMICKQYGLTGFTIRTITIRQNSTDAVAQFVRFNPDGVGTSLFCKTVNKQHWAVADPSYIKRKLGKFIDEPASCEIIPEKGTACAKKLTRLTRKDAK